MIQIALNKTDLMNSPGITNRLDFSVMKLGRKISLIINKIFFRIGKRSFLPTKSTTTMAFEFRFVDAPYSFEIPFPMIHTGPNNSTIPLISDLESVVNFTHEMQIGVRFHENVLIRAKQLFRFC